MSDYEVYPARPAPPPVIHDNTPWWRRVVIRLRWANEQRLTMRAPAWPDPDEPMPFWRRASVWTRWAYGQNTGAGSTVCGVLIALSLSKLILGTHHDMLEWRFLLVYILLAMMVLPVVGAVRHWLKIHGIGWLLALIIWFMIIIAVDLAADLIHPQPQYVHTLGQNPTFN